MMPFNPDDLDVFVCPEVLLEVRHGTRLSAVRQFGIDWDGPITTAVHKAVFEPLPPPIRVAQLQDDVARRVASLSLRERVALAVALSARGVPSWVVWWLVLCVCGALWWWKG